MAGKRLTKATLEREALVVEMRTRRMTFTAIAKELGISQTRATQIYQNALNRIPAQRVQEHRAEELMLIDSAIADLVSIIDEAKLANTWQDRKNAIDAWGKIRDWSERKAKLLGLDAPIKSVSLTITQIDTELSRARDDLIRMGIDPDDIEDVEYYETPELEGGSSERDEEGS